MIEHCKCIGIGKNKIGKIDSVFERKPFKTILIFSAIFFMPPIIPNALGGIMDINLKDYSIATFLGNLPNTFFTVYFIKGLLYSNINQVYISIAGITIVTLGALYLFSEGLGEILRIALPGLIKNKK